MTTGTLRLFDLDETQRESFRTRGYCIVANALDPEMVEHVRSVCDRIADEGGPKGRYVDPRYEDKLEYRDIVSLDPVFREVMVNPRVFPIVTRLLGPNLHLMSSHFIYKMSRSDAAERRRRGMWHRDVLGVTHDLGHRGVPMMSVRTGYYLTPVDEEGSGTTLLAPGSHLLDGPLVNDPHNDDPPNVSRPPVHPGDALVWENRLYHAVEQNTSGRTRKALMFQYGFRWLRPFDYLAHPPELLAECDPMQRQLLAAHDVSADGSIARERGGEAIRRLFEEQGVTWEAGRYAGQAR